MMNDDYRCHNPQIMIDVTLIDVAKGEGGVDIAEDYPMVGD
jgi:hypothetical protein